MLLHELLKQLDVVDCVGRLDVPVSHVTRDSREVGDGSVFVAIRGARVDGHAFVPQLDAAAVVVERDVAVRPGVTCVRVADTHRALGPLAAGLHGVPSRELPVVGVTGTNGKTTVTTLASQALGALGHPTGHIGTTGIEIAGIAQPSAFTTPEAPQLQALLAEMRDARCHAALMEVSSIGLDLHRVDGTAFHAAVFTHLGRDHLDFHGTQEAYAAAKARLFQELLRPAGGLPRALVYADDPAWASMRPPADRWTYGFERGRDLHIRGWASTRAGLELEVHTPMGVARIQSPLVGRYNAANLTAALGIGLLLDVDVEDMAWALGHASGAPGRMERVVNDEELLLVVDYAHTPDALTSAIEALRPLTDGRLWVVFGCGGDRDVAKRPEMGRAALSADAVVVTSDNPRSEDPEAIVRDIVAGIDDDPGVHVEVDRRRAIFHAIRWSAPGDTVLIAGKGHERTQTIGDQVLAFDDRDVAREALESL
jgi:UDP-N-acetylmuramoyl-L-alanyl-D-glutamate--2,6-diaminopimelate ligase